MGTLRGGGASTGTAYYPVTLLYLCLVCPLFSGQYVTAALRKVATHTHFGSPNKHLNLLDMATIVSVDVRKDGVHAFQAMMTSLPSAPRVVSLTVHNCGESNMKALAAALLKKGNILDGIESFSVTSGELDDDWALLKGGATELAKCLPRMTNLKNLTLQG